MKSIRFVLTIIIISLICISCSITQKDLEGATIYTTIYPIKYVTNYLYSEYSNISSIYPLDSDPETYKLNDKQYNNYSKGNVFIYNGFSKEKEIAKELINRNGNLLIIDVSYGLNENTNEEELWINPNNYLIVAKNIKNALQDNLKSKYIIDQIDKKYTEFDEKISIIEARLHNLAKEANDKNRIIVIADKSYLFLNNYGFSIIDLTDDNITINNRLDNIKSSFKAGKYRHILASESTKDNETVTSLKGTILTIKDFNGVNETDYFNYMTIFMDQIETIVS